MNDKILSNTVINNENLNADNILKIFLAVRFSMESFSQVSPNSCEKIMSQKIHSSTECHKKIVYTEMPPFQFM